MNKPITSAIVAACALCAAAAPIAAKTRAIVVPSPKPRQIVETANGFVINERVATEAADKPVLAAVPIGASVRLDASLLRGANGETTDAQR
ncbi:hypothetical protein [Sphingopyxis sp. GC21]|uniref:hypothetical protein n=1 Tax=Sphingopyxis sp. GC21 TaxID=2933562 RepID=UPI0021E49216|nr:hypothetical protein [Sphingopyxis sp. GC21]